MHHRMLVDDHVTAALPCYQSALRQLCSLALSPTLLPVVPTTTQLTPRSTALPPVAEVPGAGDGLGPSSAAPAAPAAPAACAAADVPSVAQFSREMTRVRLGLMLIVQEIASTHGLPHPALTSPASTGGDGGASAWRVTATEATAATAATAWTKGGSVETTVALRLTPSCVTALSSVLIDRRCVGCACPSFAALRTVLRLVTQRRSHTALRLALSGQAEVAACRALVGGSGGSGKSRKITPTCTATGMCSTSSTLGLSISRGSVPDSPVISPREIAISPSLARALSASQSEFGGAAAFPATSGLLLATSATPTTSHECGTPFSAAGDSGGPFGRGPFADGSGAAPSPSALSAGGGALRATGSRGFSIVERLLVMQVAPLWPHSLPHKHMHMHMHMHMRMRLTRSSTSTCTYMRAAQAHSNCAHSAWYPTAAVAHALLAPTPRALRGSQRDARAASAGRLR